MTLRPARNLSAHAEPKVDEARLERAVHRMRGAATVARPPRVRTGVLAVALFAAAAAWFFYAHGHRTVAVVSTLDGTVLERGDEQTVTLPDGSRMTLHPESKLRFQRVTADDVELSLEHGTADFVVPHLTGRRFVVHAGAFEVVDVGTSFRVDVDEAGVRVSVSSGRVEIRQAGRDSRFLDAPEAWASTSAIPLLSASSTVPVASDTAPAPSSRPFAPAPHVESPKELMERADEARFAGRPKDAAASLDKLRRTFRTDPRAGLAAFELGRLRLDVLDDAPGAVEAFDDAILLSPVGTFREDAEARRVEALDRARNARCQASRDAYLSRYPTGIHAGAVAEWCRW